MLADAGVGTVDVWVVTMLGEAEPRLLYRHGHDPRISPDGLTVAFLNYEFGKIDQQVWVGKTNGEAPQKLVDVGPSEYVFSPVWFPPAVGLPTPGSGRRQRATRVLPSRFVRPAADPRKPL